MLEVIERLLILQEKDRQILRTRSQIERIGPDRDGLKVKSRSIEEQLAAAKDRVNRLETERKQLELEVEANKEKIAKYSVQQFQTKKNEEYRALGREMEGCRESNRKLDDRQLELMEEEETAREAVRSAQTELDQVKTSIDEQIQVLNEKEENLKRELEALEAGRHELTGDLDRGIYRNYQGLLRNKGAKAVVGISNGVCGGCHMKLPTQLIVTCRGEQEIVNCLNCGRILYYTRDMELNVSS